MKGIELVLTDLFKTMPEVQGKKPCFSFGLEQLNRYIQEQKEPYPLIYLTSNREDGEKQDTERNVPIVLILAVNTDKKMWNEERYLLTFKVLDELVERIIEGFSKTANINWDGKFKKYRYPEYTESNENITIDLIDAYRFECQLTITNKCQNTIQWQEKK